MAHGATAIGTSTTGDSPGARSGPVIGLLALAAVLVHLPFLGRYGWSRDELYYLASSEHLDWGFVDQPPLAAALLAGWRGLVGDSLVAIRLPAVFAGGLAVILVSLLVRRMGGGRFAVALAGLCYLGAPAFLGVHHFYSMAALEPVIWLAAGLLLVRALDERSGTREWLGLGAVVGLGLLNQLSALWLTAGIGVSLFLVAPRQLTRRGPWLAGLTALVVAAPYLAWSLAHGWPALDLMRGAQHVESVLRAPMGFATEQTLAMNPASLPVWIVGLAWLWSVGRARPFRALGVIWVVSLLVLLAVGAAHPSDLAAATAFLLAAGAVAWERFMADWSRGPRRLTLGAVALTGVILGPLAVPALPIPVYVDYAAALGVATDAEGGRFDLPRRYADMQGWEALVREVTRVHASLPPDERDGATILGNDYGDAAAVDHLGRELGLPAAISGHNAYWDWGPRGYSGEVTIGIGGDISFYERHWHDVVLAGRIACEICPGADGGRPIWVARGLRAPLASIWGDLRRVD